MKSAGKYFALFVILFTAGVFFSQLTTGAPPSTESFRAQQKKAPKVKEAYNLKWEGLKAKLHGLGVDTTSFTVFIRGFKDERELEVWVKSAKTGWKLFETYRMCYISGGLGPKRCQGDGQVPEGFYHVSVFNPYSNYLISLGVSYPNASDNIFGCKRDRGGAIMIHGDCVSIGCIPITDDRIREVYVLCVEAKTDGQQTIPIHLFPARLTDDKLATLKKVYTDAATQALWSNLKEGYDKFETTKTVPEVTIDAKGKYIFR